MIKNSPFCNFFFSISDRLQLRYHTVFSFSSFALSSSFHTHSLLQAGEQKIMVTQYEQNKVTICRHAVELKYVYIKNDIFFSANNLLTSLFRPQKIIWHGSTTNGIRLVSNYCEAWHTADLAAMGQASPLNTGKLLDQKTYSCNNRFIVLCIENSFVSDPQGK